MFSVLSAKLAFHSLFPCFLWHCEIDPYAFFKFLIFVYACLFTFYIAYLEKYSYVWHQAGADLIIVLTSIYIS